MFKISYVFGIFVFFFWFLKNLIFEVDFLMVIMLLFVVMLVIIMWFKFLVIVGDGY